MAQKAVLGTFSRLRLLTAALWTIIREFYLCSTGEGKVHPGLDGSGGASDAVFSHNNNGAVAATTVSTVATVAPVAAKGGNITGGPGSGPAPSSAQPLKIGPVRNVIGLAKLVAVICLVVCERSLIFRVWDITYHFSHSL